jgi:fatty-acyl-CoA synthase
MVIRGGENLYPKEIEEFLLGHGGIVDVQVFGVRDDVFGEELCAWIVRRPGAVLNEQGVREFCHGRIAHHKVPRHIRFVEAFPLTITGKVQKSVLRARMEQELGLVAD